MEIMKIGLLLAKVEGTYGSDPTPTAAANAIAVVGDSLQFRIASERVQRLILDKGLARHAGWNTKKSAEIRFRTELRGNFYTLAEYANQAVAVEADDNKITLAAHTLRNGDLVKFTAAVIPAGLTADTWYYVVAAATNDFQVAATFGGDAIDITSDGTTVVISTSKHQDVAGGRSAYALRIDPLLAACDLAGTYTAEASAAAADGNVIYKPTYPATEGSSVTFYWNSALKLHKLTGAKGSVELVLEAGKPAYLDWTFRGIYNAITDVAISTYSPSFSATKPPLLVSATATWNSYAAVFSRLSFNLGNAIGQRDDILSAQGIRGFLITDKSPSGSIDPESVAEATHPFWANWAADTVVSLSVVFGTQTGNKFQFLANVQPADQNYGDRNGGRIHQLSFEVVKATLAATAGDELQLKWY
jgi:hypothetical protein